MLLDRFIFRPHLHAGEKLLYVVHSHWAVIYKPVVQIAFFGLLFPVVLWAMFPPGLWFFAAWFGLAFLRFLYEVMNWYFDVLLVTSHGIVDLDWRGFFDKSSNRIDYENLVGVAYDKSGFWPTVLNYGPLVVEREGHAEEQFGLPHAADPKEAERQILLAREKSLEGRSLEDGRMLKQILSEMVGEHVRKERDKSRLTDLM